MFNSENNTEINGFNVGGEAVAEESAIKQAVDVKKEVIEWLSVIASALIIVVILFGFVFRVAVISGTSMQDTLHGGDVVVITNLNYTPKYGDIVVISRNAENTPESMRSENGPIIKRVIATEGQKVRIDFDEGIVYVDDKPLVENYTSTPTTNKYDIDLKENITVPKGHIFVLGDNRGVSLDSRSSRIGDGGMIDTRYVLGHAVFRFFPFDKIGGLALDE